MDVFQNIDLLSVGIAIAATCVLGFTVYFSNTKSVTNRIFLYFSITTALWGLVNYFSYQFSDNNLTLLLLRLILFFAVFQAFFLYDLFLVFPDEKFKFSKNHRFILLPVILITAFITLTPWAFSTIVGQAEAGQVAIVAKGGGLAIFGLMAVGLVLRALYFLFRKIIKSTKVERRPFMIILSGTTITFALIILFNLIVATVFSDPRFIPLGALFTFPFVAFAAYAITRHKLFNIKVISTALVTFILTVITFAEIIYSNTLSLILFRSGIFILVLVFGINLIRGVIKEVEQRERIEKLAEELEKANERQEGLIHFISHQIKGYLTKSKAAFASIIEGDFGIAPPEMQTMVKMALNDNQEGVNTVMSILSAANLKKGTVAYKRESFDFQKMVEDEISSHKKEAVTKGLYLETYTTPKENYTVIGDSEQISKHVIANLIDNSIKYTLQGGLKISLMRNEDKILFSVKDTGVGVSDEDKKRLFTEGGRGKDSVKVNVNSTGYGLYIAKEIVEAHKGRIWVESEGPKKGSTFFVELPGSA